LLLAYTHRASVHLDPPLSAQRSARPRRRDQADAMMTSSQPSRPPAYCHRCAC